jgi:hypothetical protein
MGILITPMCLFWTFLKIFIYKEFNLRYLLCCILNKIFNFKGAIRTMDKKKKRASKIKSILPPRQKRSRLVDVGDLMNRFNVNQRTIHRYVKKNKLKPLPRSGNREHLFFKESEAVEFFVTKLKRHRGGLKSGRPKLKEEEI